jgi:hypothetical protein
MRRRPSPEQLVRLVVVGLLVLMAAGFTMMVRSGPPPGQLVAALNRARR